MPAHKPLPKGSQNSIWPLPDAGTEPGPTELSGHGLIPSEGVALAPTAASVAERASSVAVSGTYGAVLRLSGPMILAMTGEMLMQFVDGVFLSWHSVEAVAALGPAGLAAWGVRSLFVGTVGYVSTFVAQYHGAGRSDRIGASVWQAVYLSLAAGLLLALLSGTGGALFALAGHSGRIAELEGEYFRILCLGAPVGLLAAALAGFLSGLGRTRALMVVEVLGQVVHAVLAYAMIFGSFGLPSLGIAGAAWATVIGQSALVIMLAAVFLSGDARRRYRTWAARRPDLELARRLVRFGLPNGARFFFDMLAWTLFLVFIGRIGDLELAASAIVFRINGVAFFPMIGVSMAVAIIVGQAQGAGRPDIAAKATWRGLALAQVWMVAASVLFLAAPRELFALFHDESTVSAERWREISDMGVVVLRFVALYGLLDGFNVVFMGALQGAGDTRYSFRVMLVANILFGGSLLVLDQLRAGIYPFWAAGTVFVMGIALVWLARFRSGRWRSMRVVEAVAEQAA
jgi:MATE family multidrug resistance protein